MKKYIEPPDHKNFRKKPTADFLKFQLPHAWNFIHLFLFPAILDLCTRGAPSPAHAGSGRRAYKRWLSLRRETAARSCEFYLARFMMLGGVYRRLGFNIF
ncbi:MAG: hypothetical protein OIN88_15780 [Candidatus Methanoperedens sp.]|nr:hypothetical protein [Candidatus Methanoperedens sp.]